MNLAVVTVRTASERLPGKALLKVEGKSVLQHVIDRLLRSKKIDRIALAVTSNVEDLDLIKFATASSIPIDVGEAGDVVSQIVRLTTSLNADLVLRVTVDCPFLSSELIDAAFDFVQSNDCDTARLWGIADQMIPVYGAAEFPLSSRGLKKIDERTAGRSREHLCDDIEINRLVYSVKYAVPHSRYNQTFYRPYRLELDTPEDLELVRTIHQEIGNAPLAQVVRFLDSHPELASINSHISEKTGPAMYSAESKIAWKHQQTLNSVWWNTDWSWLTSGSPQELPQGSKAVYCRNGTCYIGHSQLAVDGRVHLYTVDADIVGRASVECRCGAGKDWYEEKKKK